MFIVSPKTMNNIDRETEKKYAISSIILMENAGIAVSNYIIDNFKMKNILIIAGPGNNGGDAFVIARHLKNKNYNVNVCYLGSLNKYSNDSKKNFEIIKKMKINIFCGFNNINKFKNILKNADLIIDGIFGTGFKGEIRKQYLPFFKQLNKIKKDIISIDIPSGINGLTGIPAKYSIKAHSTICFGAIKTGLLWNEAQEYIGNLIIADISIPPQLIASKDPYYILDKHTIKLIKSNINFDKYAWVHKMAKGKCAIIGGNTGMEGAPQMTAISALKSGSGISYVYLLSNTYKKLYAEIVFVKEFSKIYTSNTIIIGPGLNTDENAKKILINTIKNAKTDNIIIDADGLNIISQLNKKQKKQLLKGKIITPHPQEFKRLSGKSFNNVDEKINYAIEFAKEYNVLLILKSPPTIITDGENVFVFPFMNKILATAGSGDILAGIIGGFISYGIDPFYASLLGVYTHFVSGNLDYFSISANDIINNIKNTIKEHLL